MTDHGPAIETNDLTKRYGDTTAVESLDITVPRGTVYGFLGPNGAGKTTTMRLLTTLTKPTGGTATIMGTPIAERDRVRPNIGYLPEEPPVFDELTGREQLMYMARLRDMKTDVAERRIDEWFDRFRLTDIDGKRIEDFSKGMRQKIGVIQALLHEPAVVFLDEPTSGLDPRAARTVIDAIHGIADAGHTVFLSTHILPVVEELADTVGVLDRGRLVTDGPPAALTAAVERGTDSSLEDVFLAVTTDNGRRAADDG